MTDPAVEAAARAVHPADKAWEDWWITEPLVADEKDAFRAGYDAALREQGWGPITPEMKAVCEAAKVYTACWKKQELPSGLLRRALVSLGRALLKEDGNYED